ncbi:hypothetical protein GCM10009776_37950 [Microbacterium deminutum]|uniref:HAF repeat-containing protein n=2 Tax=Microbacterium deminutum TaxID=344164 RepID=A0ABP5CZ91_9MICO
MNVVRGGVFAAVVATALAGLTQATISAPSASTVSVPATRMRDLGTLGGLNSYGVDINVWGQVTGTSDTSNEAAHAFRWTSSGGMQDLGTLDIGGSSGTAINELGQVIGVSLFPDPDTGQDVPRQHAFRWTAAGGMQDLGTLGGGSTEATAINNRGQVVGSSYLSNGHHHAFLWTPTRGIRDLGTLGGANSSAIGINDLGQITGSADKADGNTHAFRWTPTGGMQDLGTLGGSFSEGTGINASGQVIGNAWGGRDGTEGFLWTSSGGMRALGFWPAAINTRGQVVGYSPGAEAGVAVRWTASAGSQGVDVPDGFYSDAVANNDLGQIVGYVIPPSWIFHAFRWKASTGMTDLGTLGGQESFASAINIRGQVTGSADKPLDEAGNRSRHAFLWSP